MKRYICHTALLLLTLFCSHSLLAQISYGGEAVMNTEDFRAEDVLYLLPPEEALVVEAAKSFQYNQAKKAIHYAVERDVDLSPEFNGGWVSMDDMRIWRVHIISPQAYSLGVLFSEFELSDGVRIFIYDESGEHIKGAFTSQNNKDFRSLFVSHIPGEQVIIEMQVDNNVNDYGKLRVGSLSHAIEPVFAAKNSNGLGASQDCEIDINCMEGDDWQFIKKSVCQIATPNLLCTGILVNNTSYDGTPYILTAEHCLNNDVYSQNTVYTFRYENDTCGIDNATMDQSVSGGELIATGIDLDFSLIRLTEDPPGKFDLYFAGWDRRKANFISPVAIHHPNADAMKISFDFDTTATATWVAGDVDDYIIKSNFWIKQWDIGTTEGGSSGSPLFNSNKRLIGLLSGGFARCGSPTGYDEVTDRVIYDLSPNHDDFYSRFYYAWDHYDDETRQLKKWLDPINSGMVSIGGLSQNFVEVSNGIISDNKLLVYPNPSHGEIYITIPETNIMDLDIEVYNVTGSLVHQQSLYSQESIRLNLYHLQNGIYFVRLRADNFSASSRILIQK